MPSSADKSARQGWWWRWHHAGLFQHVETHFYFQSQHLATHNLMQLSLLTYWGTFGVSFEGLTIKHAKWLFLVIFDCFGPCLDCFKSKVRKVRLIGLYHLWIQEIHKTEKHAVVYSCAASGMMSHLICYEWCASFLHIKFARYYQGMVNAR